MERVGICGQGRRRPRGRVSEKRQTAAGSRRKVKRLLGFLAGTVFLGGLVGCSAESTSLQLEGSSSMERYVDALAEGFMERHPEVTVTVQFTGSSAGIEAVADGRADIGNSSRSLFAAERERGITETVVAMDGIALCVDAANPVDGITKAQLADIYTGKIRDWSALGGGNLPIVVVGREAGSGTRESFEGLLGISGQCTYANELDSMGAVMARVAATPGAIGYVSFDVTNVSARSGDDSGGKSVALLALDGVAPTMENLENGSYALRRPFVMATRGELSAQSNLVREWLRYVDSREGRDIARKTGLAPIDKTGE